MKDIKYRKRIGEEIFRLRAEKGIDEKEFAEAIGENIYFLRSIEHGTIDPTLGDIFNILKVLDMKVKDFFAPFD